MKPVVSSADLQDAVDTADLVNGVGDRSSKEPSPGTSPTAGRKNNMSQSSTLPSKNQDLSSQLEGLLHRKHEWEGHNKKASNRYEPRSSSARPTSLLSVRHSSGDPAAL